MRSGFPVNIAILYVSYINDGLSGTGLKQALAKVNDYNPLMKDFPLNDLLSASELERIRTVGLSCYGLVLIKSLLLVVIQALVSIFSHMRKIRSCQQYPIQRALRLIEAISRDLMGQMLKVSCNLNYYPYVHKNG